MEANIINILSYFQYSPNICFFIIADSIFNIDIIATSTKYEIIAKFLFKLILYLFIYAPKKYNAIKIYIALIFISKFKIGTIPMSIIIKIFIKVK